MHYQLCLLVVFLLGALAAPIEKRKSSQQEGDITYFTPGLGSCGIESTAKDLIAALNAPQMANGDNPNHNKQCGRKAKVTGYYNTYLMIETSVFILVFLYRTKRICYCHDCKYHIGCHCITSYANNAIM